MASYLGPCFTCGRGEQTSEMCPQCQSDFPDAWAARQGLVAAPLLTVDEQERADRATKAMIGDFFEWPWQKKSLSNMVGY